MSLGWNFLAQYHDEMKTKRDGPVQNYVALDDTLYSHPLGASVTESDS